MKNFMQNKFKSLSQIKFPHFNVYDFFIVLAYGILNFYLFSNWHAFSCKNPLNYWLAIDYALLIAIRVIYVVKHSEYSERTNKVCRITLYVLVFPFIIGWSILGLIWYPGALTCIPDDLVPWSYILWLVITVVGGIVMFADVIYDMVQYRKLNKFIRNSDENERPLRDSWSRMEKESDKGINLDP